MSRIIRSAKGQLVDFDLLRIKNQLSTSPKAAATTDRQEFVEAKTNRRIRRSKGNQANTVEEVAKQPEVAEKPTAKRLNKTTPK